MRPSSYRGLRSGIVCRTKFGLGNTGGSMTDRQHGRVLHWWSERKDDEKSVVLFITLSITATIWIAAGEIVAAIFALLVSIAMIVMERMLGKNTATNGGSQ